MGPHKAAEMFLARHPEATSFEVTLYGSLAATGRGHMTDVAINNVLSTHAPVRILWEPKVFLPFHPNGMLFKAIDTHGTVTEQWTVYSVGGGALAEEGKTMPGEKDIYELDSLVDIMHWCEHTGRSYWEYVQMCEESDLWDYLAEVWRTMQEAVERGLEQEGVLPGPLNLRRKAAAYYIKALGYKDSLRSRGLVFAYALAVSEENAAVVTMHNLSVATSGDYRNYFYYKDKRYSHTIIPQTGYPVEHKLASVSVFHKSCMMADGLATAIMVMGEEDGLKFANRNNIPAVFFVRTDNNGYEMLVSQSAEKLLKK